MKVLGIAPYTFLPAHMGGQKGIALFYKYLGGQLPVTVVSTKQNHEEFAENYSLIKLFGSSKLRYINLFNFFSLKKIIEQNKITHLIAEHPYMGWLAVLLKKFTDIKLIAHSHNIEGLRFKSAGKWWWKLLWQYERWVHQHADINFFITHEDNLYAQQNFTLLPARCYTITYGTEKAAAPDARTKIAAKKLVQNKHIIAANTVMLLFNGALNYAPNLQALEVILNTINPVLEAAKNFNYIIIICGKGLPEKYENLQKWQQHNILFAGFVNEIEPYFLAADIFINPVIEGGGIKTKLVEALAYGNSVVSTVSGAIGIPKECAGERLIIVPDNDWKGFANAILHMPLNTKDNDEFYTFFYWRNIAKKAAQALIAIGL